MNVVREYSHHIKEHANHRGGGRGFCIHSLLVYLPRQKRGETITYTLTYNEVIIKFPPMQMPCLAPQMLNTRLFSFCSLYYQNVRPESLWPLGVHRLTARRGLLDGHSRVWRRFLTHLPNDLPFSKSREICTYISTLRVIRIVYFVYFV